MTGVDAEDVTALVDLGGLALTFGRVNRITYHQDSLTLESDTDHTVMLGWICCAFAEKHFPDLDLGLIAQFCLAHDLPEVYAGDTPTLRITTKEREAKKHREDSARRRISMDFQSSLPWVADTVNWYESQNTREARYVKAMDKLVPKITHILNYGITFKMQVMTRDELLQRYATQLDELKEYASDFPELFEVREGLIAMVVEAVDSVNGWGNSDN